MNKFQEFINKIPDREKELPKVKRGNTIFYSSKPLTKSQKLNIFTNRNALIVIAIAIGIAALILLIQCSGLINHTIISGSSVEENLSKQIDYSIPFVPKFLNMSNDEIDNELANMTQVPNEHAKNDENFYDKFKAPDGSDLKKVESIVKKGLNNIDANEASYIYNGGWELTVDRNANKFARIRYVDFKSGTEDVAIKLALETQNFEDSYISKSDTDELGNTYSTGTAKYNGKSVSWRISAIKFKDVYNINLPDNSIYVGIRVE
ncbi:MAG: hypothetical protein Q4E88_04505 [Coriobacteriia bacterium]|nr:hypothetical protein [Coriobacteriia bacterium]